MASSTHKQVHNNGVHRHSNRIARFCVIRQIQPWQTARFEPHCVPGIYRFQPTVPRWRYCKEAADPVNGVATSPVMWPPLMNTTAQKSMALPIAATNTISTTTDSHDWVRGQPCNVAILNSNEILNCTINSIRYHGWINRTSIFRAVIGGGAYYKLGTIMEE